MRVSRNRNCFAKIKSVFSLLVLTGAFTLVSLPLSAAHAEDQSSSRLTQVDRATVDKIVGEYSPRPRLAALQMISKYGVPQEASPHTLVWHNAGPYKRIMVTRMEIPHDFPKPHMDYLEHTVEYNVPADKTDDLVAYDGSVTVNRTAGELSARCDLEGHNILTLNLAHDIVTGKKNSQEARKAFGEIVVEDMMGKRPAYVESLQFSPSDHAGPFPDEPVIPGSSRRAKSGEAGNDAEKLGLLGAINENEILAAAEAGKKKIKPEVLEFSKMMHKEHGMNLDQTLKLGQKIGTTPLETEAVEKLRVKGAEELAILVPLDGDEFGTAYAAAMVKAHTEALGMLDNQLMKDVQNEELKAHLMKTREHIARHLEEASGLDQ